MDPQLDPVVLDQWYDLPAARRAADRNGGPARLELRQLRYFVTLAEELHFGRAAAREHIVQSALSQQVQRLERALGVSLVERSTRHVQLTEAGRRFVLEAQQILTHVDRAVEIAHRAARSTPALRVGVTDESYPTWRPILAAVQDRHPDMEIHQIHAGMPEQLRLMEGGRLDIGMAPVPSGASDVVSELIRQEPLGVLLAAGHHLAALPAIPVAKLIGEALLLADEQRAPEHNRVVIELCQSVGFDPDVHRGTVQSLRSAADLVQQARCVLCIPASCAPAAPDVVWRPFEEPAVAARWFVLSPAQQPSSCVTALIRCARELAWAQGWLDRPAARPGRWSVEMSRG
jgi:DNA-binding transcriptional LysR family regulator